MRNEEISWGKYIRRGLYVGAAALAIVAGVRSCTVVPAGHVAVKDTLGKVAQEKLHPGLHFINPFSSAVNLETRTLEEKEEMSVPTKEGLIAKLDVSILYRLNPEKADTVYKDLGMNYKEVIVSPVLRNVVRDVIAGHSSEDLYSQERSKIGSAITERLTPTYAEKGVILDSVLLRGISLPPEVTAAIERKMGAKQAAEQMEFVLQKERQESQRKEVEAEGIANAQHTIAQSLTPEYLQWRYITTMSDLAHSQNTTFVIAPYDTKLTPMLPLEAKAHTMVPAKAPQVEK